MTIKQLIKSINTDMKIIFETDPEWQIKHNRDTYQLVAVGGDMSAMGMSNIASIIEVDAKDWEKMNQWMQVCKRCSHYTMESFKYLTDVKYKDRNGVDELRELMLSMWNTQKELLKEINGYFPHKYYARTTWAWMQTPQWKYIEEETA